MVVQAEKRDETLPEPDDPLSQLTQNAPPRLTRL